VLWTTRAILRDIADVLMERVPRGLCINTINDDFSRVGGQGRVSVLGGEKGRSRYRLCAGGSVEGNGVGAVGMRCRLWAGGVGAA
jgi:hypothetical protein